MPPRTAILLVGLLLPTAVHSASFDCTKAQSRVEKQICASADLRLLDVELYEVYHRLLRLPTVASDSQQAQRQWLKERRDRCETGECFSGAYMDRIQALRKQAENANPEPQACSPNADTAAHRHCLDWHTEELEKTFRDLTDLLRTRYGPHTMAQFDQRQSAWKRNIVCACEGRNYDYMGAGRALGVPNCELEFWAARLQEVRLILVGARNIADKDSEPMSCEALHQIKARYGPQLPQTATSRGEYVLRATDRLHDNLNYNEFCSALTANLNQFRDLDFEACNPRLSPKYSRFSRPTWEEIPLDIELAAESARWKLGALATDH